MVLQLHALSLRLWFCQIVTTVMIILQIKMKLQQLIRFLLLTAAVTVEVKEVSYSGVLWQPANVRASIKDTPSEELKVKGQLFCAAEALRRPWCSLYCYADHLCRCYAAVFPPSLYPATGHCKTKYSKQLCKFGSLHFFYWLINSLILLFIYLFCEIETYNICSLFG